MTLADFYLVPPLPFATTSFASGDRPPPQTLPVIRIELANVLVDVFSSPTMVDCFNTYSVSSFACRDACVAELRTETVSHGPSGELPAV
jgi:hypothetical protein